MTPGRTSQPGFFPKPGFFVGMSGAAACLLILPPRRAMQHPARVTS